MKRSVDTSIWGDPWFTELSATGKMVFLYLLTNERSTAAGIFDLSPRRMAFDIGIAPNDAEAALVEVGDRVRWWPEHNTVWVINFFRHQAVNDNFLKSAQRTYADLPEDIRTEVVGTYPEFDTNPLGTRTEPVPTGKGTRTHIANSKEQLVKSDEEVVTPPNPPRGDDADELDEHFDEFWSAYPKKVAKQQAVKSFKKINWRKVYFDDVMAALAKHKASAQWTKDDGQFIPNPATWLNQSRWEDDMRPAQTTPTSPQQMTTAQRLAEQARRERAEYEQARGNGDVGNAVDDMAGEADNGRNGTGLFLVAGRRTG